MAFALAALLVFSSVGVANAATAPQILSISAPLDPVQVSSLVTATAKFTDPDSTAHTAMWTWGDGASSPGVVSATGGNVTGVHSYALPGVFRVGLEVVDEAGQAGRATFEYVVVYDASGGFVTGGGWIDSLPGAYPANPSLTGRANFGLVAKYKPGASDPDGTTEFQFHAADFNFHSLDYEWLVVSGAKARYKGTGTIHGRDGVFRFLVTAIDGDLLGRGQPDRFRIKVFDDHGVIYDNQMGAGEDADPVTALGGGSIVIHKGKGSAPVNHAPIANAGPDQTVLPGTIVTLSGAGSSDPDGNAITYSWNIVLAPAGSAADLANPTTVSPTFTADVAGEYIIELVVDDGSLSSAPDEVSVIATAPDNAAPVAVDDSYSVSEDQVLTIAAPGILSNDTDADGDALSAALVSGPAHGTLTLAADGSFTYTPDLNYSGLDSFTYRASDGALQSGTATVNLSVTAVNDPPVANDDSATTPEGTPVDISILANDSDLDGTIALSSFVVVTPPTQGTVTIVDPATLLIRYTPPSFHGIVTFTYQICDTLGACDTAVVTVTVTLVNDAPVAIDDSFSVSEDTPRIVAAPGILANDSDADGDPLTAALVTGPSHGSLTLNSDGSFTYTPAADYAGPDSFTYRASDGALQSATATVNLTVTAVNDPPVANDDSATTPEDSPVLISVLANDSDTDGTIALSSFMVVTPAAHGTTEMADPATLLIRYTPSADFHGTDTFTYRICDTLGACDTAVVTVTVTPVNDAPVAIDDSYSVNEDAVLIVTAPGVLANDIDVEGDALTAILAIGPGNGTLTLNPDGSFTYTPNVNFFGADSYTYRASDGAAMSAAATVHIDVAAVNDPPVANDDGASTDENTAVLISVLANDSDVEGALDRASFTVVTPPTRGTTQVADPATVLVRYTPLPGFHGTDTFTYRICDTLGACDTAVVTIEVASVNAAPVAVDDSHSVSEDQVLTLAAPGILGNDTDADGDALSAALLSGPAHGALTLNADGSFTYTPGLNYAGPDSFSYRASDGAAFSAAATVQLTVSAVNDPPVASDDSATTAEDTAVLIDVRANDSDVDSAALTATITIPPAHGTAAPDASGQVSYTPAADYFGPDSFTYQLCDAAPACDTALVSVTVTPVNDPPTANAGADKSASTGQPVTLDGSGSDPDGDTLTYSWAIVAAPTGSTATLSDPLVASPTFTPDRVGLYRFELTVNDGAATDSDEVDVAVLGAITLAPDPLDLQTNATGALTVTLSAPAGAGGQLVDLLSSNPLVAAVPSSVLVPDGATSVSFDVTTFSVGGTLQVTASATGFASDSATVNVGERALTLSIQDELVGVGRTTNATVTLSTPAPPGGTVVTLVTANTGIATVSPATVTIPEGATQGTAVVGGVAVGTTTLTASAPGYTDAVANVVVTDALISIGFIPTLGVDEVESVPISLTKPAPPGGLTITLTMAQPGIATVSPTSTVPAGQFLPPSNPQVTGHTLGTTEVTASAPGFAPDHRSVTVALFLSWSPNTLTLGSGTSRNITLQLSATAPVGGLTVNLATDNPLIATVATPVTIPQGQTSLVVPVTGVSNGTTPLRANSAGITQATATIIVGAPITIVPLTIGKDLQAPLQASLGVPAPAGNLPITFTSADPSKLIISSVQTAAGGASATSTAIAGNTFAPAVYVQALASSGTVQVTATAPGYADGVATITLVPSGFWIFAPGIVSSFNTTTFAANTTILARSSRLNASLQLSTDQEVRGGLTVTLDVQSSVPAVGTITGPITFVGGTGTQKQTAFDPISSGVSILSFATPTGFSTPTTFQTVTANVDAPNILINPIAVGRDLQQLVGVSLESAPPGPVDVTISVVAGGEGTVALSKVQTAAGSSSITFTGVTSGFVGNFYAQGLAVGTAQISATAAAYDPANPTVTVTPSGFYIFAPGIVSSFSTTTFATNTAILLRSSRLNSLLQRLADQELRGGLTVNIDVVSSNTAVGVITTSPVQWVGGTGAQKQTAFDPQSSGTSTISFTQPSGFEAQTTFQTVAATVDAPDILIGSGVLSVGRDLQQLVGISLESAPPSPVDVIVTVVPGGEGITSITKVQTAAGSNTVTFTGVTSTFVGNIWVQGLALGSAQLRATAANYNLGTASVTVTPSGFQIFAPGIVQSFTTNTFAPNTGITLASWRLTSSLSASAEQEVRGGLTVNIPVTSSLPAVGTITSSPVVFAGGTGTRKSTQFDPQTVGTSTLSMPSPVPGFSVPTNLFQTVTMNVRAPEVRIGTGNISSHRVGRDLQLAAQVTLENAPPEPVDITITVISGGEGITSISKVQTAVGTTTLTFAGVTSTVAGNIYIQGRSLGSTQLTGVAAGYNDAEASVSVEPSGFYILAAGNVSSFTTTAGAGNTTLLVRSATLDPVTLNFRQDQEVRGGISVNVTVTSSNTAAGAITTSPVVFVGGTGSLKTTAFDPLSAGTGFASIPTPVPGFSTISNQSAAVTFTVLP